MPQPLESNPTDSTNTSNDERPARPRLKAFRFLLTGILVMFFALPFLGSYNELDSRKTEIRKEYDTMNGLLQRRYELSPQLETALSSRGSQYKDKLDSIIAARTAFANARTRDRKIAASNELGKATSGLLTELNRNTELQRDQAVRDAIVQVEETESRITDERHPYNESVRKQNATIRTFPFNVTAALFGFERAHTIDGS